MDGLPVFIAFRTKLGAYLDPLADKVLITTAFVLFANAGVLSFWFLAIIIARDITFLLVIFFQTLSQGMILVKTVWSSKLNTTLQIMLAALVLLEKIFCINLYSTYFVYGIVCTTVVSLYEYAFIWGKK